ncbi:MAG: acetylxylan esterase, partial [Thermoguttaceae bacterium]|nr:acetylxylan esterase [Thermoguttaceae bacterium]
MSAILRRFTRPALAATAATLLLAGSSAFAQNIPAPNYDEAKVPKFELPDPLVAADGTKIETADDWRNKRRPELLDLFAREMFGKRPSVAPEKIKFEELTVDKNALGGKATRKEIRIYFDAPNAAPKADLLLYFPNDRKGPAPVFVMPNFEGNWATTDDPGVRAFEIAGHVWNAGKTPEQTRGAVKGRWSFDRIVSRGYAVATLCYEEVDADFDDGFKNGVHPLFGERSNAGDETASIAAWAWALSRALDCLETLPEIDATKAIVAGHSRLGKTALWAGAQDERFAAVISNNSGCGGAALSRREFGETVAKINKSFPHWFCGNFKKYGADVNSLP